MRPGASGEDGVEVRRASQGSSATLGVRGVAGIPTDHTCRPPIRGPPEKVDRVNRVHRNRACPALRPFISLLAIEISHFSNLLETFFRLSLPRFMSSLNPSLPNFCYMSCTSDSLLSVVTGTLLPVSFRSSPRALGSSCGGA